MSDTIFLKCLNYAMKEKLLFRVVSRKVNVQMKENGGRYEKNKISQIKYSKD